MTNATATTRNANDTFAGVLATVGAAALAFIGIAIAVIVLDSLTLGADNPIPAVGFIIFAVLSLGNLAGAVFFGRYAVKFFRS